MVTLVSLPAKAQLLLMTGISMLLCGKNLSFRIVALSVHMLHVAQQPKPLHEIQVLPEGVMLNMGVSIFVSSCGARSLLSRDVREVMGLVH